MRTNTKRWPGWRECLLALCARALIAACGGSGTTASGGAATAGLKLAGSAGASFPQIYVVVGGARAQYKGTGTINGSGSYKFLLTAVDGDLIGKGTPVRFRMRIWHYDEARKADVVDCDNQLDSRTEGGNLEGAAIGGGSISIKTK